MSVLLAALGLVLIPAVVCGAPLFVMLRHGHPEWLYPKVDSLLISFRGGLCGLSLFCVLLVTASTMRFIAVFPLHGAENATGFSLLFGGALLGVAMGIVRYDPPAFSFKAFSKTVPVPVTVIIAIAAIGYGGAGLSDAVSSAKDGLTTVDMWKYKSATQPIDFELTAKLKSISGSKLGERKHLRSVQLVDDHGAFRVLGKVATVESLPELGTRVTAAGSFARVRILPGSDVVSQEALVTSVKVASAVSE